MGVVNAFTAFSEVYIDDMWVHSLHRGKGYGKKLLQALEDRFEGKGFNNINLVTNAFNAPGFYKKCGFTEEFLRVNKVNPKLTKTFFIKHFKNTNQTQGILKDKNTDRVLAVNQLTIETLRQSDLDESFRRLKKLNGTNQRIFMKLIWKNKHQAIVLFWLRERMGNLTAMSR